MRRSSFLTSFLLGAASALFGAAAGAQEAKPADVPDARIQRLHRDAPLVDGHNDMPWALRREGGYDLVGIDISQETTKIHTDIPRLRKGGVWAQFWSVWVPTPEAASVVRGTIPGQASITATLEQVDLVHRFLQKYPKDLELALTAADVQRIVKGGRIASLIGIEGGHSIDNSLGALRMFYRLGVRYMTLTWSNNLPWADAGGDKPAKGGLTAYGEEVVKEMNRLGMIVDLSHTHDDTALDALRVSVAPVLFTHSCARALNPNHPRTLPDEVLKEVTKNGGVVMVTFIPEHVSQELYVWDEARKKEQARVNAESTDAAARKAAMDKWTGENKRPFATVSQVADHVDHVRKVAGVDHVGIGGDYDGIFNYVQGLEDVSLYPALTRELIRRGWTDTDLKKLLGANSLRVMAEVEKVALRLQRERPPSIATLGQLDGPPPAAK
jgi:membrane dipeptidase